MDLSIIIAHYDPGNHPKCIDFFQRTLNSIIEQKESYNIEIIIADDGSISNNKLMEISNSQIDQNGKIIYCVSNEKLDTWKTEKEYPYPEIQHWLYLPKSKPVMSKASIGNAAINISQSENLLFLDDDNYFISNNSLKKFVTLLNNYHLVFGQIQDSNGRLRPYSSNRVQGTTFAVKKEVVHDIGGFGEWTESVSSGVDSDIWWKLYQYFQQNPHIKACYTSKIQTIDSCSKRWKPYIKQFFRHHAVKKEFKKVHSCANYRSIKDNPSRIKSNWIDDLT